MPGAGGGHQPVRRGEIQATLPVTQGPPEHRYQPPEPRSERCQHRPCRSACARPTVPLVSRPPPDPQGPGPDRGEVPERSNGAVSKTVVLVTVPRVRIPASPPPPPFALRRGQNILRIKCSVSRFTETARAIKLRTLPTFSATDNALPMLVTDRLRSYDAAMKEYGNACREAPGQRLNNRDENSHLPFRRRERAMLRFRRRRSL